MARRDRGRSRDARDPGRSRASSLRFSLRTRRILTRQIGASEWVDVTGGRIDPTRAYDCRLPSGKTIAIFFYDGPVSQGSRLRRLAEQRRDVSRDRLQTASRRSAVVGRAGTYRHRRRELRPPSPARRNGARLRAAPHRVERARADHQLRRISREAIRRPTKSRYTRTPHGVVRTASDAGGKTAAATQAAVPDGTSSGEGRCERRWTGCGIAISPLYEERMREYLRDPWLARNDYIEVVLDRSPRLRDDFITRHAMRPLNEAETRRSLEAAGDAASRDADVYELRMVL